MNLDKREAKNKTYALKLLYLVSTRKRTLASNFAIMAQRDT